MIHRYHTRRKVKKRCLEKDMRRVAHSERGKYSRKHISDNLHKSGAALTNSHYMVRDTKIFNPINMLLTR